MTDKLTEDELIIDHIDNEYFLTIDTRNDNSKLKYHHLTKHEAEQLKKQILANQKLREVIETWNHEVDLQLTEITKSKHSGSDYHNDVLNLYNKLQNLIDESEK